jgi:hypothetical protein
MLVVGGGIEAFSRGPGAVLFLDWLKRRNSDVLRVGRESVAAVLAVLAVNCGGAFIDAARPVGFTGLCDCACTGMCVAAGGIEAPWEESGGLGKLLRTGSYCRLLAKSSKLTSGMKL